MTLTSATLLTTIGPLSAITLGASDSLASFTVGIFLIGAALSSIPSAWLFRRLGRFLGFSVGCASQVLGAGLGVLALTISNLTLLYLGCLCVGFGQGLGQFSYSSPGYFGSPRNRFKNSHWSSLQIHGYDCQRINLVKVWISIFRVLDNPWYNNGGTR